MRPYLDGEPPAPRVVSISENWGFASFETEQHKLVVDEDALVACQLFDLGADPDEDDNRIADPECRAVVDHLMESFVRPFFATAPVRPHRNPFAR